MTEPTLPDGMCLSTGEPSLRDEYLTYSRIPSRLGQIKRRELRRRAVEEEGQQRCLMEVACNGDKDEESVSL